MLRNISLKALIVSNVAHWCLVVSSVIVVFVFYCAGATFASDGTSSLKTILAEMKSSAILVYVGAFASAVATIPAGYIAAKLAPRGKLLSGALSTSSWYLFCVYSVIWGTGGDSKIEVPHWLDLLTSFGLVIPALAGAYLWEMRADRRASVQTEAVSPTAIPQQREITPAPAASTPTRKAGITRMGTGLGVFVAIISQILLTKHEQHVMFFALLALIALMLLAAFAAKALKSLRQGA